MAIKKFKVNFTRQYEVETDENASIEFVTKLAQSKLNSDLCWEIDVIHQFDCKIINKNKGYYCGKNRPLTEKDFDENDKFFMSGFDIKNKLND